MSGVISSICDVLVMLISFGNLVYLIQTYKSDKKERLQQQEEQREGIKEGMKAAALRMLEAGKYALEEIAAISGLPLDEIKKLHTGQSV